MRTNHTVYGHEVEVHTYSSNGGYVSTIEEGGEVLDIIHHRNAESEKQAHTDATWAWCELPEP